MRHKNLLTDRLENVTTLTETIINSLQSSNRSATEVLKIAKSIKQQLEFISERLELESQD